MVVTSDFSGRKETSEPSSATVAVRNGLKKTTMLDVTLIVVLGCTAVGLAWLHDYLKKGER